MSRRAATFAAASVLILVLVAVGALLPVPYVVLLPGPTTNTLGKADGKSLITVDGHSTYPTKGHLNLVTVAYRGDPEHEIHLFIALRGWFAPQVAVLPQQVLFPSSESVHKVIEQSQQRMRQSQNAATAAALRELGIPIRVKVRSAEKGYPARGTLRKGDVITAVDGKKVTTEEEVADAVTAHKPRDRVHMTIGRNGERRRVTVGTTTAHDRTHRTVIGVVLTYAYPFKVRIRLPDVGGPSAGMMFALGIIDKLTPGSLTGGRFVAGTGTIKPDGDVGMIGGITQKMIGARRAGATVFLTPAKNCAEAAEAAPDGLRLVKVKTLHGALRALKALRTDSGKVPSCE
ncbi:MAG: YlbL family protein [Streptosporangiaceae bacterium]